MSTIITPEDLYSASIAVLTDCIPKRVDTLFIHGSCINDASLDDHCLTQAVEYLRRGEVGSITLNGSGPVGAYPGVQDWLPKLRDLGVPRDLIHLIKPADKTALESKYLLDFAYGMGWKIISIRSQPHHQLRCFLQMVALTQTSKALPLVFNRPVTGVDWNKVLKKISINPQVPVVEGTFDRHCRLEVENINRYAVPVEDRCDIRGFTPHATIEEMFKYFRWRSAAVEQVID